VPNGLLPFQNSTKCSFGEMPVGHRQHRHVGLKRELPCRYFKSRNIATVAVNEGDAAEVPADKRAYKAA
jgi:hypothetical protein